MLVTSVFSSSHNVFKTEISVSELQLFWRLQILSIYFGPKSRHLVTSYLFTKPQFFLPDQFEGTCKIQNECSLTLSQTTNFRLFQNERVCKREFQIWWKRKKVLQAGRKHCGKKRNCSSWAISPFPTVFSKDFFCRHLKTRACMGKG